MIVAYVASYLFTPAKVLQSQTLAEEFRAAGNLTSFLDSLLLTQTQDEGSAPIGVSELTKLE